MAKMSTNSAGSGSDDKQSQTYPGKGNMGTDGNKEKKSSSSGFGMQGGKSNHMLTGMTAAPQQPGQTASQTKGGGKYIEGGKTHMFGLQEAGPQEPGVTGHSVSGGEQKYAQGGKTHMFGYTGSKTATPA